LDFGLGKAERQLLAQRRKGRQGKKFQKRIYFASLATWRDKIPKRTKSISRRGAKDAKFGELEKRILLCELGVLAGENPNREKDCPAQSMP
jgi:hypothetical protein